MKAQTTSSTKKFIAYYRVSTNRQGQSGLGLESQKAGLTAFFQSEGVTPIAEFTDVESGAKNDRTNFVKALELAKKEGATIIAFRLDRLLRKLSILSQLRDAKVSFTALDCLQDTDMIISIKAAFAEEELRKISERATLTHKARKERGLPVANPNFYTAEGRAAGARAVAEIAATKKENLQAMDFAKRHHAAGLSLRQIADKLNGLGYLTSRGKNFEAVTVKRLLERV